MSDATIRWPRLLSPVRIGPMQLAHRAIMAAHGMGLGSGGPGVSPRYHAYLVERARGGAALIGTESAPVHHSTFSRSLVIRLDDDACVDSLARLAADVHEAGSKLSITLWHGGHKDGSLRGPYSVAPSPIPNMSGDVPKELSLREIREIVAAYGMAAARCRRAGLDCLEVQTATDYLLGSFLSPALNHRRDAYGGSLENRTRIVREVLQTVREAAGPAIAVGVRCSARHDIPGTSVDYTLEESIAAMRRIAAEGLVDYVSVMSGSGWAEGVSIPALHHPRACLRQESRTFRHALPVPVFVAGRIRTPDEAEALLAAGDADVIAMARSWIAEPQWAAKVQAGRPQTLRPCLSCNQGCVGSVFRGMPGTCVVNPRAGRELDWPALDSGAEAMPPSTAMRRQARSRVAVIGGGPAGLESARLAAEAGFSVTLHDADTELGGQWRLAAATPGREELGLALAWWQRELHRLDVRVELGSHVDPAGPAPAERVVWAVGAAPAQTAVWRLRPFLFDGLPGSVHAVHGRDVMAGRASVEGVVAVIDEEAGWPTLSLLHWLAAQPTVERIVVYTPEAELGATTAALSFETGALATLARASYRGKLIVHTKSLVQEIVSKNKIILPSGRVDSGFTALILQTGTAARAWPEGGLAAGDCIAPRGLWSATSDARRVLAALQSGA
jgi:2,4-dienoyl-CoA reductase-like NADH-dependent reductase (Old Yellow Enzyme family)